MAEDEDTDDVVLGPGGGGGDEDVGGVVRDGVGEDAGPPGAEGRGVGEAALDVRVYWVEGAGQDC